MQRAAVPSLREATPLGQTRATPSLAIQAALKVSHPDDELEREADHVASHVMRMPAGPAPKSGKSDDEEKHMAQRVEEPGATLEREPSEGAASCH